MYKLLQALGLLMLLFGLAGCVTAVSEDLPFAQIPEITVATGVDLAVSPSHPNDTLPTAHVEAGETVQVIGTDQDAAWLLVLYNNQMGWMPSIFSQTNIASLPSAVVVEPLSDRCTRYSGAVVAPDEIWSSNATGAVIVSGGIYRSGAPASFAEAELVIQVQGSGSVVAADYVHVTLTADDSVILFTYSLAEVELDTQVKFNLTNADDSPRLFEAAFFKDECPYEQPSTPEFVDTLPIGKPKTTSQQPAAQPNGEQSPQVSPTIIPAGDVRVVTFQQHIPLTVTLFIPPGISGTHTIELPLDLDVQVRLDKDNPPTASARVSDPSKPIAIPVTTKASGPRAGNQPFTHSPAPSQLEPGRLGPTEVCGEIAAGTVWEADASPYIVTCNLVVSPGATLTIQPGVVVKFARYTGLYVNHVLQVLGTAELPVIFTSLNDDEVSGDTNGDGSENAPWPGVWDFVQFAPRSDDQNSLIEHLLIRYSGGNDGYGAIRLENASPTLSAITFENNRLNGAEIAVAELETDIWDNTDVVYFLRSNLSVPSDQTLTIVAGMVVKFARYTGLYINNILQVQGTEDTPVYFTSLNDDEVGGDTNGDGSENAPWPGAWDFVHFTPRSDDENSLIEHLVIRYSGGNDGYGAIRLENASPTLRAITFEDNRINGAEIAVADLETDTWDNTDVVYMIRSNVTVPADQTLTIVPGMIVKFARYTGLYVKDVLQVKGTEELPVYFTSLNDDDIGGDTNNDGSESAPWAGAWDFVHFAPRSNDENSLIEHLVIRYSGGNDGYGAIRLENASPTLHAITFEDNRINGAEIAAPELATDTWDNTDVVYVIRANVAIPADQSLTVMPGMIVKFARYTGLYVNSILQVKGAEDEPIYFTSLNDDEVGGDTNGDGSENAPWPGAWDFVHFTPRSDDENSLIEHLVIRYSGGNDGYGAIRLENASPTLHTITFESNRINGVEIAVPEMETDTWDNTDVVYVLRSNLTIPADQTLTIVPGMVVKFARYAGLYVNSVLQIKGTEEIPIYFTSLNDDEVSGDTNGDGSANAPWPGAWDFIQFTARSDDENSRIEHLVIRYGGGNNGYGAIRLEKVSPTLSNITYENNQRDEVEIVQ